MEFDIPEFKRRLEREQLKAGDPVKFIQNEVRRAEEMKVGIAEENDHASEFVSEAINRIDTYVFQLQEIAQQYNPHEFDLDQQTNLADHQVKARIAYRLDRLKERGEANAPTEDPMLREGLDEEHETR